MITITESVILMLTNIPQMPPFFLVREDIGTKRTFKFGHCPKVGEVGGFTIARSFWTPFLGKGRPPEPNRLFFFNIVQTAFDPPPLASF